MDIVVDLDGVVRDIMGVFLELNNKIYKRLCKIYPSWKTIRVLIIIDNFVGF